MSVPSLRVNDHHRFMPEMRDEVLDKLRQAGRATGGTTYRMLTPQDLRQLAEFESPSAPVISFYLQLTPDRRVGRAWHIVFKNLVAATLGPITDERKREKLADELQRIETALQASCRPSAAAWPSSPARPESCGGRSLCRCRCRTAHMWDRVRTSDPWRARAMSTTGLS